MNVKKLSELFLLVLLTPLSAFPWLTSNDSMAPGRESRRRTYDGEHTAWSLLRVGYKHPRVLTSSSNTESSDPREFDTFRRTQAQLIRSSFVINAALRNPNIAQLQLIRQHDDPAGWLASAIRVDFPEDCEILCISLTGDNPDELKALVNAITEAYFSEVVNASRNQQLARIADLERLHSELEERARSKRASLRKLSELSGIPVGPSAEWRQRIAIENIAQIRRELTRVNLELIKTQVERSVQERDDANATDKAVLETLVAEKTESDPVILQWQDQIASLQRKVEFLSQATINQEERLSAAKSELDSATKALEARRTKIRAALLEKAHATAAEKARASASQFDRAVAVLNAQRDALQKDLEVQRQELENLTKESLESQLLREEIEQGDRMLQAIATQLETVRLELQAPPRVVQLQSAEVTHSE